ncbi:PhoH family protein [Francisella adeliensis]|uniref:PhoH-like protein n=1 Tax=Francisella adeliensis TaxID=2007306 RepID=A0A2Z4XXM3_9GAMM|nr:PhoH family protein [Francisella adeliensis]AXA33486.1 phosphate starvation-inducible protein PhoH [Francisella adeliensis]MBK2084818.1 PhoH family protein [Francisella adeliensis]MBK2097239.1 PhoH family protein [Francisella adeliensis]QIW11717.1 PhoH family protein [Francisella adeliensis]QIW13591.1 PhoH family protein [Francisella adeliensis]
MNKTKFTLEPYDNDSLGILCGNLEENIRAIENYFNVEIKHRADEFEIESNSSANNTQARRFVKSCYAEILGGSTHLDLEEISTILNATAKEQTNETPRPRESAEGEVQLRSKKLRARTQNQAAYLDNIKNNFVTFGVGPAGTGKTYLAIACAVAAYERGEVRRIVLVRPAVEAGEKLGFLPGDLTQKIDPYLRPMYDALFDFMGVEKVTKLIERQAIEIAPLAYMRGRTINDSFIVLDESQNTTKEQMKMFLTRIGFNTTAVITGDVTQVDLPKNVTSGMKNALKILSNVDGIGINYLKSVDIVRHEIVQKIVNAYDKHENNK